MENVGKALLILNLGSAERSVSLLGRSTAGKDVRHLLSKRLLGPKSLFGRFGGHRNVYTRRDSNSGSSSP